MHRVHRLVILLLALTLLAAPTRAERPASEVAKACGLTGTEASVVVDVYDDASPGALLDTIPNGDVSRVGSTDCYQTDLAATGAAIGFPDGGDPLVQGYTLVFRDDAGNSVELTTQVHGLVGADAKSGRCEKATPVYASTSVPERGITAQVIEQGKPSYLKIDVACDLDFDTPSATYYEVMRYDAEGRVESRTPSGSVPSP